MLFLIQLQSSSHNLTLSGGSERVTYSVGGSHLYQEGIVGAEKSDFTRSTARFNLGIDISDMFDFSANSIYTHIDRRSINEGGLGSVLFNALNMAPTFGLDEEDLQGRLGNEIINPLSQIENTFNDYNLNKFNGSFALDFLLNTDELKFTSRIGYNLSLSKGKDFFL
jgi:TonB-dependent starch-binding outer membrane protein SusC